MAGRRSAGILLYRWQPGLQVLLGHMGGPFWARRAEGAWTLPKGEPRPSEDDRATARREFEEELGLPVPSGSWLDLGEVRQSGGKLVRAWAVHGDIDPAAVVPGTFETEWPPRSGRRQTFPELDRVEWLDPEVAARLIVPAQRELLDRLRNAVRSAGARQPAE